MVFTEYEKGIIKILTVGKVSEHVLADILDNTELSDLDFTGCGYFLTVKHDALPNKRIVCNEPTIMGTANSIHFGFVVFIENKKLTFECFTYDDEIISDQCRTCPITINIPIT